MQEGGAWSCGWQQVGNPVGVPVAGRVMGPGVGAQRHPQMDVRDATGLGTLSMLGSGTMGTARVPMEQARGGRK